jgi:aspartate aminotransferase-like enzyme
VELPAQLEAGEARRQRREDFGVHVQLIGGNIWRVGLLGANARLDSVLRLLTALERVVNESGAVRAAIGAYGDA